MSNRNRKRSKAKFIIIGAVVFIAILAVVGYLVRGEIMKMLNPRAYLALAAANTASELNTGSSDNNYFELLQDIYSGSFSQTVSADLNSINLPGVELPDIVAKAGLAVSTDVDRSNKASLLGLKLRISGAALLSANLFIDNDMLALQVPELYDSYVTVPTADFAKKWNESTIAAMSMTINEDIDINNAFDLIYGQESPSQAAEANRLQGDLFAVFTKYYAKTDIQNGGGQNVELPDGTGAKLSLISVSLTRDEFKQMIKDVCNTVIDDSGWFTRLQEQYAYLPDAESIKGNLAGKLNEVSFGDPVVIGVYCDNKHRIVYLSIDTNIISTGAEGRSTRLFTGVSLNGTKKLGDLIQIKSRVTNTETDYLMLVSSESSASRGEYSEKNLTVSIDDAKDNSRMFNCRINTSYDGADGGFKFSGTADNSEKESAISLNAAGNIAKDDNAKSFKADFSDLTFEAAQSDVTYSVSVKGGYSLSAQKENIANPEGAKDLLSMNELELYGVMQQIYIKISSIPTFSDILGNMYF